MSEQQNLEIVRRGYDAFGRGDVDTLLSLFDDNIEWATPGPPELPTAGQRRGLEQVRGFFKAVFETYDIQKFVPETFVAEADRVVVFGTNTAAVRATGNVIVEPWAHSFMLKNGKVVSFREYLDTSASVAELHAAEARA